jgi:amino acid permease
LPEGILSLIVLIFVAAGMPAIMNPDNQQALNTDGSILNANLYFFSWAGLAVAVYIFCTWLFHHCFKKRNLTAGVPSNKWYLLLAAAVIVVSSASRLLDQNCESSDSKLCHRTKFAIAAGAMGTFCALVVSILSFTNHLSMWPEAITAGFVCVLFVLGIAFLTFGGENAPASNVGNLFFSTVRTFCRMGALLFPRTSRPYLSHTLFSP